MRGLLGDLAISVEDGSHTSGHIGLDVHEHHTIFDNLRVVGVLDSTWLRRAVPEAAATARAAAKRAAAAAEEAVEEEARRKLNLCLDRFFELAVQARLDEARALIDANASDPDMASFPVQLTAAADVLSWLRARDMRIRQGARKLVGQQVELQTRKDVLKGRVEDVTQQGVVLVSKLVRGRQVLGETRRTVPWADLSARQEAKLLGGWKMMGAEGEIANALVSLIHEDTATARQALSRAGDNPLAEHARRKLLVAEPAPKAEERADAVASDTSKERSSPPGGGILRISTLPASAKAYVNGKGVGKSPIAVAVTAGTFNVVAKAKRYDPCSETVNVAVGETKAVHLVLLLTPVPIEAKCNVAGRVLIDGSDVGPTNGPAKARPGLRELAVVAEGYCDGVQMVEIPFSGKAKYSVRLKRGASFRTGAIPFDDDNWTTKRDKGWTIIDGRAVLDSANVTGDLPTLRGAREITPETCRAIQFAFRATNIGRLVCSSGGANWTILDLFKTQCFDGEWHLARVEVNGRVCRGTIDGIKPQNNPGPGNSKPSKITFHGSFNKNNDPARVEIRGVVFKNFASPEQMALALGTSPLR